MPQTLPVEGPGAHRPARCTIRNVEPAQTHGTDAHLRAGHAPCSDRSVDPSGRATAGRARTSRGHDASHRIAGGRLARDPAAVLPEQGRDPGCGHGAPQAERRRTKGSPSPWPSTRGRFVSSAARPLSECGSPGPEHAEAESRASASHSVLDQQPRDPSGSHGAEGSAAAPNPPRRVPSDPPGAPPPERSPGAPRPLAAAGHARSTAGAAQVSLSW